MKSLEDLLKNSQLDTNLVEQIAHHFEQIKHELKQSSSEIAKLNQEILNKDTKIQALNVASLTTVTYAIKLKPNALVPSIAIYLMKRLMKILRQ